MSLVSSSAKIVCGRPAGVRPRMFRFACGCALLVLAITMTAKVYEVVRWPPYMTAKDPVLAIPTGLALGLAALGEAAVGLLLLTRISARIKSIAIGWLCALFITYRTILHVNQPGTPCKCLGSFLDKLGLSPDAVAAVGAASILMLLVCAVVIWVCRDPSSARP
jgi:hypothetical protein